MGQILVDIKRDGLASITLNRPDKLNAVSKGMTRELSAALRSLEKRNDLKCLVITGSGSRAFCAGGDLNELHGGLSEKEAYQVLKPMGDVLYQLAVFPLPTIALLNGQARGGGCELATACDFRYGVRGSAYGFVQGKLGITPGWGGGELLYQRIRPEHAAHWLIDSQMYSAEKAHHIGWLNKIGTREELEKAAAPFLEKTYDQLHWFKKQYLQKLSVKKLEARIEEEVTNCAKLWESKEHIEAVRNFMNSRKKS
ncbi:enoyl-CoA hydratase/isomerase family protein [Halobacillus sp. Marseille-Q1614]|uniref:enoyl-CoA hydratase/isomerase family protein n=1 Tax=Halobacillus sp. Marseille-Q1614 TaxID=2709134 RepID=UPI00156D6F0E|nr:enoyl-CoA hydratase/isomerase family protein [Halobacillus sp. Marseille-Q1614]